MLTENLGGGKSRYGLKPNCPSLIVVIAYHMKNMTNAFRLITLFFNMSLMSGLSLMSLCCRCNNLATSCISSRSQVRSNRRELYEAIRITISSARFSFPFDINQRTDSGMILKYVHYSHSHPMVDQMVWESILARYRRWWRSWVY